MIVRVWFVLMLMISGNFSISLTEKMWESLLERLWFDPWNWTSILIQIICLLIKAWYKMMTDTKKGEKFKIDKRKYIQQKLGCSLKIYFTSITFYYHNYHFYYINLCSQLLTKTAGLLCSIQHFHQLIANIPTSPLIFPILKDSQIVNFSVNNENAKIEFLKFLHKQKCLN